MGMETSEPNVVDLFVSYLAQYVLTKYGGGFEYITGNQDRTNDGSLSDYILSVNSMNLLIEFKRTVAKYRTELNKSGGRLSFIVGADGDELKLSESCHFISGGHDFACEVGFELVFDRYIPVLRRLYRNELSDDEVANDAEFVGFFGFAESIHHRKIGLGSEEFDEYLRTLKGVSDTDGGGNKIEALVLSFDPESFRYKTVPIHSIDSLVRAAYRAEEKNRMRPAQRAVEKERNRERNGPGF